MVDGYRDGAPRPPRVLIVEDEAILAMDLEFLLSDLGHDVVAIADSLAEVQTLSVDVRPDLALVDMHLAGGSNGLEVCADLLKRWPQAMVVFVTGNVSKIPADFAGGHGAIQKPFSQSGLVSTLRYLSEGMNRPPPSISRPSDFIPSPQLALAWQAIT